MFDSSILCLFPSVPIAQSRSAQSHSNPLTFLITQTTLTMKTTANTTPIPHPLSISHPIASHFPPPPNQPHTHCKGLKTKEQERDDSNGYSPKAAADSRPTLPFNQIILILQWLLLNVVGTFDAERLWAGRGGAAGNKFRMSLGLPVGAVINCADNTGAKNLYVISVTRWGARLNRLPACCGLFALLG